MSGLWQPGEGPNPGPGTRVARAAQMRAMDARAVSEYGVGVSMLMENAGRAAADAAESLWAALGAPDRPIVVLAGPGNNGGDGFSCARTLKARGRTAVLWRIVGPGAEKEPRPEVQLHRALWERAGGRTRTLDSGSGELGGLADEFAALEADLQRAALLVDALFGTGLSRPLGQPFTTVLEAAQKAAKAVLALDVPSGIDADTGAGLGGVLAAHTTVTFGALKPGLFLGEGQRLAGRVLAAEIGLPPALLEELEPFASPRPGG